MTILEKINNYLEENKDNAAIIQFDLTVKKIIQESIEHLNLIGQQMCHYDKHDKLHSEKVIKNIENLLGRDGINNLTIFEAYLIYLSGYLHDIGMALPDWAFELLKEVEDKDYEYHNSDTYYSDIRRDLIERKKKIYSSFERINSLVFCTSNETDLIDALIFEIYEYECFRCGYKKELDEKLKNSILEYKEYSDFLGTEYLRLTHGKRSEKFIKNLWRVLTQSIGEGYARRIANSLAKICNSHCADIQTVESMEKKQYIFRNEYYNEQYVAILLRLGDVIHFSNERAPESLYLERTIMNPISDNHWTVKFQDLDYYFESKYGEKHIVYSAYCKEPQLYYFLNNYLDWVDNELMNYYKFIYDMERKNPIDYKNYKLPLAMKVDREISYPPSYRPDNKLKFTLNQNKVIALLMGVQLYKDKFMCLREVYQNALDACKCMNVYYEKKQMNYKSYIEFGVEEDNQGKFIYCLDNGIGMTKHMIENYLLNVGNSYYMSREFLMKNYFWNDEVIPVSMFGVGLLSCYMLGNHIEVITKSYQEGEDIYCICMELKNLDIIEIHLLRKKRELRIMGLL